MNIPIPSIFRVRTMQLQFGHDDRAREDYAFSTRNAGKASECVNCLQCEGACPQGLPITELLKECAEALE